MKANEIKEILSSGKTELFEIDPQHKAEITRTTIAAMARATLSTIDRAIKKSVSAKRSVKIIVVS